MRKWIISSFLAVCLLAGCGRAETTKEVSKENTKETVEQVTEEESKQVEEGKTEQALEQSTEQPTEQSAEQPVKTEEKKSSVSLLMVGDILLHTPVEESAKAEDGSYDFDALFTNTKEEIQAADMAIVNQEVIIGGKELGISGYPAFNAPYEIGDALVSNGFDVVCHGTNHALDKGKKGILNCLSFWKENYPQMAVLGIYDSQSARDAFYVYEKDGIRIAVLNYTYGTNGIPLPSDMPYAVNMLEEKQVIADIQKAEQEADFTVVCPHWGTEYELGVSKQQEKWTALFLENGVDLVLGTHPHVIEPIELVKDEETGREMLVYYSIGNYVNWTSGTGKGISNRMVGGMAEVSVERNEQGDVCIADYGVKALVCHLTKGYQGVTTYFLSDYNDALAAQNAIVGQDSDFSMQYCTELCNRVWGELWE